MELYLSELNKLPKGCTVQSQLTRICRKRFGHMYHGTYGADQIPNLKPNQSAILNLDRSDQAGSHWIAYTEVTVNAVTYMIASAVLQARSYLP
jgi:hypothetical protein